VDLNPADRNPGEPGADRPAGAAPPPIVVGVDDSPAALAAATAAAELARRTGAAMRLVRAWAGDDDAGRAAARARLDQVAATVADGLPAGAVSAAVRPGPADLVLRDESRAAGLLVLGTAGAEAGLGPVAVAMLRRSVCPVLLHRPAGPGAGVVAGADGGPGTARLLTAAATGAAIRGMPLLILHAWSGRVPAPRGATGRDETAVAAAERRFLEGYLAPLRETWPEVAMEVRVVHDRPEAALLDAARSAALVVLGRHDQVTGARRPAGDREPGSTVVAVAAAAPGSVLVVPLVGADPATESHGIRRRPITVG
jgi:nucleotide-binding universal stress UspA family protein